MSPNVRRALHQALDLVCDALAEEERDVPKKRVRGPAKLVLDAPTRELSAEERAQLDRHLLKAGYKRAG